MMTAEELYLELCEMDNEETRDEDIRYLSGMIDLYGVAKTRSIMRDILM